MKLRLPSALKVFVLVASSSPVLWADQSIDSTRTQDSLTLSGELVTISNGAQLTLNTGSLVSTGTSTIGGDGSILLGSGLDGFTYDVTGALHHKIGIIGDVGLTKTGEGILYLRGANTYTGVTEVSQGTLKLGYNGDGEGGSWVSGCTIGSTQINVRTGANLFLASVNGFDSTKSILLEGGSTLENGGTQTIAANLNLASKTSGDKVTVKTNTWELTLSGQITGDSGLLINTGPNYGVVISNANNAYSGGTIVSAGVLKVRGSLGTGLVQVNSGGNLSLEGGSSFSNDLALKSGSTLSLSGGSNGKIENKTVSLEGNVNINASNNWVVSSTMTGTGTLTKKGSGILLILTDQAYSGDVVVESGTLRLGTGESPTTINGISSWVKGSLASKNYTVYTGATLEFCNAMSLGSDVTITLKAGSTLARSDSSYGGAYTNSIVLESGQVTMRGNSWYPGLDGVISGAGGILFTGGQWTIYGNNTYQGGTVIQGTVGAGSNTAFGTGDITVNNGGALNLGGRTIANALTVNTNGSVNGNFSLASGASLTINEGGKVNGAFTLLDGATFTNNATGEVSVNMTVATTTSNTSALGGTLTVNKGGDFANTGVISATTTVNNEAVLRNNGSMSGAVTVKNGGLLKGIGSYAGAVLVEANGIFVVGNSPGTATVQGSSAALTLTSGAREVFSITAGTQSDGVLAYTGVPGSEYSTLVVSDGAGFTLNNGVVFDIVLDDAFRSQFDLTVKSWIEDYATLDLITFASTAGDVLIGGVNIMTTALGGDVLNGLISTHFYEEDALTNSLYGQARYSIVEHADGSRTLQMTLSIPEPSTATLGLVALAGLMMRRRRRAVV